MHEITLQPIICLALQHADQLKGEGLLHACISSYRYKGAIIQNLFYSIYLTKSLYISRLV